MQRLDELKAFDFHPRVGQPLIELGAEPMLTQTAPVDFRVELALPRVDLHVSIQDLYPVEFRQLAKAVQPVGYMTYEKDTPYQGVLGGTQPRRPPCSVQRYCCC